MICCLTLGEIILIKVVRDDYMVWVMLFLYVKHLRFLFVLYDLTLEVLILFLS